MLLVTIIVSVVLLLKVVDANQCKKVICGNPLEKCIGNTTHATCVCKDGFYRVNSSICEKACDIHFCFHNGVCEQGSAGRTCRCVSPFHGNRCENERTISVQIAVGSSVMAAVLIAFLAVIIWRNRTADKDLSEKKTKPWMHVEFQEKPDSFHGCEEVVQPEVHSIGSDNMSFTNEEEESKADSVATSNPETRVQIIPGEKSSPKEEERKCSSPTAYVNLALEDQARIDDSKVEVDERIVGGEEEKAEEEEKKAEKEDEKAEKEETKTEEEEEKAINMAEEDLQGKENAEANGREPPSDTESAPKVSIDARDTIVTARDEESKL